MKEFIFLGKTSKSEVWLDGDVVILLGGFPKDERCPIDRLDSLIALPLARHDEWVTARDLVVQHAQQ